MQVVMQFYPDMLEKRNRHCVDTVSGFRSMWVTDEENVECLTH